MILFGLLMILICQLFHLNDHFFLLLFCFNLLFHHHYHHHLHFHFHIHIHFNFHNLHLHFHNLHFLLFYFLLFHFLLFYFYFLDFLSVKIIFNNLLNKFNIFLCSGVHFLYFIISAFFISCDAFKSC